MADLVKDASKLYKVLFKYLPKQAVGLMMVPVFTSYMNHMVGQYIQGDDPADGDWS